MTTIKVIKGNKIVRVTENELAKYLSKGYKIVKENKPPQAESVAIPVEALPANGPYEEQAAIPKKDEPVPTKKKRSSK